MKGLQSPYFYLTFASLPWDKCFSLSSSIENDLWGFLFFGTLLPLIVSAFLCDFLLLSMLALQLSEPTIAHQTHLSQGNHIPHSDGITTLGSTSHKRTTRTHTHRLMWWLTCVHVCVCVTFSWQAGIWWGSALFLWPIYPFQSPSHLLFLSSPFLSLQAMQPPVLIIRHRPQFDA